MLDTLCTYKPEKVLKEEKKTFIKTYRISHLSCHLREHGRIVACRQSDDSRLTIGVGNKIDDRLGDHLHDWRHSNEGLCTRSAATVS